MILNSSPVRFALAVFLVAMTSGCGSGALRSSTPSFDGSRASTGLRILVRNQQLNEARITFWADGTRRRLGSVQANSDREFRVPMNTAAMVRLEIDFTLGGSCVTRSVQLGPGDAVDLTIPPQLGLMDARCSG